MQRYFVSTEQIDLINKMIIIKGNDFHHMKNVMRMKVGTNVFICDENSNCYLCEINTINDNNITLDIIEKETNNPELNINITIAMGLTRREKNEEVLRRIVELGASGFINVIMARSIIKEVKTNKLDRMETIVKEASEQSHRIKLLKVYNTLGFSDFIKFSKNYDLCLYAYEEEGRNNNYNFKEYLKKEYKNILILSGPEGGFDLKEVEVLNQNNFKPIGLGPRILRCETAPLYIMSVIAYEKDGK